MKQLSKHDVNKLSIAKLLDLLPFQITNDGVPVAAVIPIHDVNIAGKKPSRGYDVNKAEKPLTELPLSKSRQARGVLSSCSE